MAIKLKCSQFRVTVSLDHCVSSCPYASRPGAQRCGDLAKHLLENRQDGELVLAAVKPSASFQKVFPEIIRGEPLAVTTRTKAAIDSVTRPMRTLAEATAARQAAEENAESTEKAPPTSPATTDPLPRGEEPEDYKPQTTALTRIAGSRENDVSKKDTKESSMSSSVSGQAETEAIAAATATEGQTTRKRRGVAPGTRRVGRRKAALGRMKNALVIFIETEPGSNVFSMVPESSGGLRELFNLGAANRRILVSLDTSDFGS